MKPETLAKNLLPSGYKLIYLTEFGSKLYGTNSTKSDTDYKGLFLPPLEDIVLGTAVHHVDSSTGANNSKNTQEDIDVTLYSLQKFFELIKKGETGALDILFSMDSPSKVKTTPLSKRVYKAYPSLVSANTHSFIGYCMGQASKYGIKGSRYGDLLKFKEYLDTFDDPFSLALKAKDLKIDKFTYIMHIERSEQTYISIVGKLHPLTRTVEQVRDTVDAELARYGDRTKAAHEGVDWKALSHAVRVIYQLKGLALTGTISFPLKSAEKIKQIKYYSKQEDLPEILDMIADEIKTTEQLMTTSKLPITVDSEVIDKIILKAYKL